MSSSSSWSLRSSSSSSSTVITKVQTFLLHFIFPPLFVLWRGYVANRMPLMDCDEVYNYWEPLHFLWHGSGQQTWEYANEYALRTYAYLVPLQWLGERLVSGLSTIGFLEPLVSFLCNYGDVSSFAELDPKLVEFVVVRALLGMSMALAEVVWLHALAYKFSVSHAFWTAVLLLTGAGMNHAAAAYLPSATWMAVFLICHACFLYAWHFAFCAVAVTATLAIGWPFGVVLLVPLACAILYQRWTQNNSTRSSSVWTVFQLLSWTALVTVVVQAAVLWIDQEQYGRWTSATLNIFTYNAAGGGDELYGVEPVSYYVKNLLLNWNLVAPLGLVVLPIVVFSQPHCHVTEMATFLPLYTWLAITVPRPHKEERFLFPIYPLLCLGAIFTVDATINAMGRVMAALSRRKSFSDANRFGLHLFMWLPVAIIGLSRTVALSKYYAAPLAIYAHLSMQVRQQGPPSESEQLVCTCGEWYRFPSSFFLPDQTQLAFVKSSFTGQLPQRFSEFGSWPDSQHVLQPFNDQNLEQTERYVELEQCHWIVDLEGSECLSNQATIVMRAPFLNAEATSALHRILYIPFLHEQAREAGQVHYHNYVLAKP